jgi:hypothetical protein
MLSLSTPEKRGAAEAPSATHEQIMRLVSVIDDDRTARKMLVHFGLPARASAWPCETTARSARARQPDRLRRRGPAVAERLIFHRTHTCSFDETRFV